MNTKESNRVWHTAKAGIAVVMLFCASQSALAAATAANHIVRNTVTVDYADLGGTTFSQFDSVDIIINTIKIAPDAVLNVSATDSLNPVSPGGVLNVVYTVTSNSNGPDDYTLNTGAGLVLSGTTATDNSNVTFNLGATSSASIADITTFVGTTVAIGSGTSILVPADGDNTGGPNILNGLQIGETVVLDMGGTDNQCTVLNIIEGAPGVEANATSTLEVHECLLTTGTLGLGDQIGERQDVTLVVSIDNASGPGTVVVNMEVDSTLLPTGPATTVTGTTITVVAADLQIYKFVRNVTSGAPGTACTATPFDCLSLGGNTYYSAGVTALPTEQLEYLVLLYNNAGNVQNVVVTDPFVIFTSYDPLSIQVIPATTALDGGSACSVGTSGTCTVAGALSASNADDSLGTIGDFGGVSDNVLIGDPSDDIITVAAGYDVAGLPAFLPASETGLGGVIDAGQVSVVRYTVTIQ